MAGPSLLSEALEQESNAKRTSAAYAAWRALGHECHMPCEFQQLFECTLLDEEQLARAIDRKIELLQWDIKDDSLKLEDRKSELKGLEQVVQEKPTEGTFTLKTEDIKKILWRHYQRLARQANKQLTIEVVMSTDPITDEICAEVNYMDE